MRAIALARAAAQAEKIRLQASVRRQIRRGAYGFVGTVFGLGALSCAHVVAWLALRPIIGAMWASVVLLVFDLVVALAFGALAVRSRPDQVEVDAQQLRELALKHLKEEMTLPPLGPLVGAFMNRKRRRQGRHADASHRDLRRLTWSRRLSG
jgi:hypothetical protein